MDIHFHIATWVLWLVGVSVVAVVLFFACLGFVLAGSLPRIFGNV